MHADCLTVLHRTSHGISLTRLDEKLSAAKSRSVCCYCGKVGQVIVKTIRITVKPEKRIELTQTIGRLIGPIKNVKGCRTIKFYQDAADENSSLLLSEWETESDLNRYLRSNDFAILRGAITVLSSGTTDSNALVTSESIHDLITGSAQR